MKSRLWWLSFRDPDQNKWLGGCFIRSGDPIIRSHQLKVNPGGEVLVEEWLSPLPSGALVGHLYMDVDDIPGGSERLVD